MAGCVFESLERLADRNIDATPAVYTRLFARYPECEAMFAMDRDGGVRGAMLRHALECLIHDIEGRETGKNFIVAERNTHDGYGIPNALFDVFYEVIRDSLRDLLDTDWTEETTAAWTIAIESLRQTAD